MNQIQCPVCKGDKKIRVQIDEGMARYTDGTRGLGREVSIQKPCRKCNGNGWIEVENNDDQSRTEGT